MTYQSEHTYLEIRCPVETKMLHLIRNFVGSIAGEMGFAPEDIAKIEISVDEACSNVICHAYERIPRQSPAVHREGSEETRITEQSAGADSRPLMTLEVAIRENQLEINIIDSGIGDKAGPHRGVNSLDEYIEKRRGLGTYIIHKLMDKVKIYFPAGQGTVVSMVKFLSKERE